MTNTTAVSPGAWPINSQTDAKETMKENNIITSSATLFSFILNISGRTARD